MTKSQWEIWDYPFYFGTHPVVLISRTARCATKKLVNVLKCGSSRATSPPKPLDVILDEEDGLDWKTVCDCELIYLIDASKLTARRGTVTVERRREIVEKLVAANDWIKVHGRQYKV
jgi:hypothetical protein